METSKQIKARLREAGKRFWAGDNITTLYKKVKNKNL